MPEFGFYHLTRSSLEQALPKLLEKMLASGKPTLVRLGVEERLEFLDRALWTYTPESWLPHASDKNPSPELQPILLSAATHDEACQNLNNAAYLVLIDQAPAPDAANFERILELFDGNDPQALAATRDRWRWAKHQGFDLVYWQQNDRGGWQKAR